MGKSNIEILSSPLPLDSGTYILTQNVNNPRPDRRANQDRLTSWESWTLWPKGMKFIIELDAETNRNRICPSGGGYYKTPQGDPRFPVLIEYLEPVQEKPSDTVKRLAGSDGITRSLALAVLDALADVLTTEKIEAIVHEIEDKWASEEDNV